MTSYPDYSASIRIDRATKQACIISPVDVTVCGDVKFERGSAYKQTNASFQQTLIYPRFRSQFRNKLLHTEHQEA